MNGKEYIIFIVMLKEEKKREHNNVHYIVKGITTTTIRIYFGIKSYTYIEKKEWNG